MPKNMTEEEPKESVTENLQELGEIHPPEPISNVFCLTIIGQIEGHQILQAQAKTTKYEHVIPQLFAVEQNPKIEGLLVILNTAGGDVEAGLALAELIRSLSKPSVSLVLGGGHSIGIPIALSCRRSYIAPTATMTVHPIRYTGLVINGHQQFEYLQRMQERVVRFICGNSAISEEKLKDLMFRTGELAQDIGTILVGQEAVDTGLIHEVGGLKDAYNRLLDMISEEKEQQSEHNEHDEQ